MLFVSPSTAHALTPHARQTSWVIFVQVNPPGASGPIWIEGVDGSEIGRRLAELARLNAFETMLIGLIETRTPTAIADQLRQHFEAICVHDHWYAPAPDLIMLIQQQAQDGIRSLLERTHPGAMATQPVDIDEMARLSNVSVKTLRRMVAANEIPFLRWGRVLRFVPSDVIASLQKRR